MMDNKKKIEEIKNQKIDRSKWNLSLGYFLCP